MLTVDADGWLRTDAPGDPEIAIIPAHPSRHGGALAVPLPLAPVWHTTDTATPARVAAGHWAQPLPADESPASAAVIVGRDGVIVQCVPFLRCAWHVRGGGVVAGWTVDHVNHYTVGIELENAGEVRRVGGAFLCWPYRAAAAQAIDSARAVPYGSRDYDGFPPAQLAGAAALLRALVAAYGWTRDVCGRGHVDYDPARKQDPWPLFRGVYLQPLLDTVFPQAVAR